MWSKPLLCYFRQSVEIPQMQVSQGFAAFRLTLSRIPPRHTQIKRDTNFATPGYSISAMIPRRGRKSKIFLSVVIPVVKAAFVPFSAAGGKPAIARVARLCGVSPCPVPDTATALPNVARYQLRHTRIGEWGTPPDHGRRTFTISDFLRSCKGEISRSERPSEPPHGR